MATTETSSRLGRRRHRCSLRIAVRERVVRHQARRARRPRARAPPHAHGASSRSGRVDANRRSHHARRCRFRRLRSRRRGGDVRSCSARACSSRPREGGRSTPTRRQVHGAVRGVRRRDGRLGRAGPPIGRRAWYLIGAARPPAKTGDPKHSDTTLVGILTTRAKTAASRPRRRARFIDISDILATDYAPSFITLDVIKRFVAIRDAPLEAK